VDPLLDIDDDAAFFALVKANCAIWARTLGRGYKKSKGRGYLPRLGGPRLGRLLYSMIRTAASLVIEAVRKKDEATYRQSWTALQHQSGRRLRDLAPVDERTMPRTGAAI